MTPQQIEAMKLALEALTYIYTETTADEDELIDQAITAIKEALAQPEQDSTYTYASSLATAIWQKHYMKESPKWKPLDTTEGVLTQIDNMTCGLIKEKPAQPEQEPVQWGVDWGKAGDIPCVSIIKRLPNGGIEVLAVEYAPYNYTTSSPRKPLTENEIKHLWYEACQTNLELTSQLIVHLARNIEAAHGIKENT